MLAKAIAITAEAFKDKKDKGGKPYILHCLRVMNGVDQKDEELMCIAVMHDLKEDFPNIWEVYARLFSQRVINGVTILSRDENTLYFDYIKEVGENIDAKKVKIEDIKDNCNPERLLLFENPESLLKRYSKALTILNNE